MALNSFIKTVKTICSSEATAQKSLSRELEHEIDDFINDHNNEALVVFLGEGYHFNAKQSLKIMKDYCFFNHDLIKKNIFSLYNPQIKDIISNNLEEMLDIANSFFGKKKKIIHFKELAINNNAIFTYLNLEEKCKDFILDDLHTINTLNKNKVLIKYLDEEYYNPSKNRNTYEDKVILYECKNNIAKTIRKIEELFPTISEKNIQLKLNKYNSVLQNFNSLKDGMMQDVIKNIKNFNESRLPMMANKAIHEIRSTYRDIDKTKIFMNQNHELENLYKKRFPQVIEEYVTISPRYREKLKGHNENPDDLLVESLTEIQKGIKTVFESLQEKSHDRMKITHKYLKSKQ